MKRCTKCKALISLDMSEMFGGNTSTKVNPQTKRINYFYKGEKLQAATSRDPNLCLKCEKKTRGQ